MSSTFRDTIVISWESNSSFNLDADDTCRETLEILQLSQGESNDRIGYNAAGTSRRDSPMLRTHQHCFNGKQSRPWTEER